MSVFINRKNIHFSPDATRVILRFFQPGGEERAKKILHRIMDMRETDCLQALGQILRDFSLRHRNVTRIFTRHFEKVKDILGQIGYDTRKISRERQLLIGAFFSNEYSIESAAFFNPSIIEGPDQSHLPFGSKRIILSFRATGEGHVSSIVFRSGVINADNQFEFDPPGRFVDEAEMIEMHYYNKAVFLQRLTDMQLNTEGLVSKVFIHLSEMFTFSELQNSINAATEGKEPGEEDKKVLDAMKWIADAQYLISFSLDSTISERVIFPVTVAECRGIEDARFVRFCDDNGVVKYFATYTAYNGFTILPQLIETIDFYTFKVMPIYGRYAINKGMALFPRKINGRYAMLGRMDGENNYIMFSDKVNVWDQEPVLLLEPKYPWEFVQLGNSGSPIETPKGWLVVTHSVGPVRQYCLGAMLLDLEDPRKVIGRLPEPLLVPNEQEREGYVPNVVYSCGAIIHQSQLLIPYAMSDTRSGIATVSVEELLERMISDKKEPEKRKEQCRRILLVEDDLLSQEIIRQMLETAGYGVDVAADGLQALIEIGRNNYDLVLSDVNMPNFTGYQLLQFVKNRKIDIPVILVSANKSEEDEVLGLGLGAVEYLQKPISPELLQVKLQRVFETISLSKCL